MAIEKTIFTGATQDQNCPEVYAWLTANATEYFDEITQDETAKTIICKIGGKKALAFGFDGTAADITIYLANGVQSEYAKTGNLLEFAVKTSKGLYLKVRGLYADLFVTRDKGGSTAFVGLRSKGGSFYPFSASFDNSASFWENLSYYSEFNSSTMYCIGISQITGMCPMICDGAVYTPNLFFVPFTENFGFNGKIITDGAEYYYDGFFALQE